MKKNPTVNYEWYKEIGLFKKDGSFMRKGKIGDWLNYFSQEESLRLDDVVEKNLKQNLNNFDYGIDSETLKKLHSINKEDLNKN